MRFTYGLLASALLLLAGCDQQAWFNKFIPEAEAEAAKQFLAVLRARDFTAIEQELDPSLIATDSRAKLQLVADQFPEGEPVSVEVVGAHTTNTPQRVTYSLTFQYEYPGKWLLANVVLFRENNQLRVAGVHVNHLADSLQNLNRFTFFGKGPLQWIVFILAMIIPLFIIATFVLCIRTPVPRRKWLWLIFIAIGVVQLSVNWTTGEWGLNPVSFLLLGAGFAQAGPAAPYILTVALPLGAVLFWFKRSSWVALRAAA